MTPVLIIGYGNPLRSDDAVGWRAAQTLLNEWPVNQVRVEPAYQLLPEMAEWVGDANYVLFIDACHDAPPGQIRSRSILPEKTKTVSMTHHFTPQGLLADSWHLFHHAPKALVVSIGAGSFDHAERLSSTVEAVFPHLIARVKKITRAVLIRGGGRSPLQLGESARDLAAEKVESHA